MDFEVSGVYLKLVKKTPLRGNASGMCQMPPRIYQNHPSLKRTGSEVLGEEVLWEDKNPRIGSKERSPMLEEQTSEGTDSRPSKKI